MISVLKDCFDKKNHRYKVISFSGGKYQCQAYSDGVSYYFSPNEISDKPFKRNVEVATFTEVKKEVCEHDIVQEPEYITESDREVSQPKVEKKEEIKVDEIPKDNIKETADDFYADF